MKNLKKKTNEIPFVQFQLFIFYKPACLQQNCHGRLLSIRVFSASFKNIKFSRGNYQTDSSETKTFYCLYCSPLDFLLPTSSKIISNYFQLFFRWKPWKPNVKFENESRQNPLNSIWIDYFLREHLFAKWFSWTTAVHPSIFPGEATMS